MSRAGRVESTGLWPARIGLLLLRVFTGAMFLDAVHYKLWSTRMQAHGMSLGQALEHFVATDYRPMVERAIEQPPEVFGYPLHGYGDFLRNVMLPGAVPDIAGPAILCFEILLGVSLVLGLGVRLMAFLGALLMVAFGLAKNSYVLTVNGTNWLLCAVLLFFALGGAGRVLGVDARLQGRWPRWIV